ncbi:MAG: hypothetical protein AAB316_04190 [Bacteroidota bacterium]
MELNAAFIKSLKIPFSEVLPNGALRMLQNEFQSSEHTPSKVLQGAWTNEPIVQSALNMVRGHRNLLNRFLEQFPEQPHPIQEP